MFAGGCFSSFCPSEYRPYTCTSCVEFTKTSRQFSEACATQSASRVRIETAAQNETIRRYMEVYNVSLFWTGYSIANNEVVVADTDTVVQIEYSGDCSEDCCLAWRLEPYGAVALECTKELPAFCSTDRDCKSLLHLLSVHFTSKCTCVYMYTVHVSATVHIYFMCMLGVLCCFALFVCLTLLASFFLPSHLSLKTCTSILRP